MWCSMRWAVGSVLSGATTWQAHGGGLFLGRDALLEVAPHQWLWTALCRLFRYALFLFAGEGRTRCLL